MLVNISIECFVHAYRFVLFFSAFYWPIGGAVIRQSFSILHLLYFFIRQVYGPFVGSRLICTCVWWGLKWPKRGPKWSVELLTVPVMRFFFVRGVDFICKGYMRRPCWPVLARHAPALKNFHLVIHRTYRLLSTCGIQLLGVSLLIRALHLQNTNFSYTYKQDGIILHKQIFKSVSFDTALYSST